MKRLASDVLRELEVRVANLEKQANKKYKDLLEILTEQYDFSEFYKSKEEIDKKLKAFYKANGLSRSLKIKDLSVMEDTVSFTIGLIPMRVEIECGRELKIRLI